MPVYQERAARAEYGRLRFSLFKSKVILIVLLLIAVKPEYFASIPQIDNIYDTLQIICCVALLGIAILTRPFTKSRIWIFLFFGTTFLITLFRAGNLWGYITGNARSFILCLIFDLWLHKAPGTLIDSFAVLEWMIYANLATILIWPDGLYKSEFYWQNWLLGYKNYHIRTILPILCIALIRSYWKYGRLSLNAKLLLICVAFTVLKVDSATSLIGFFFFLILAFLLNTFRKWLPRLFSLRNCLVGIALVFAIFVFSPLRYNLVSLFEQTVGHASSFAMRFGLWDKSLEMFLRHPLFGYGFLTGVEYSEMYRGAWAAHPHNYFLYILLTGGIFLLGIVFYGYFMAAAELKKARNAVSSRIILGTLICFLILGIPESLTSTHLLYSTLVLGMNAQCVSNLLLRPYNSRRIKIVYPRFRFKLAGRSIRNRS